MFPLTAVLLPGTQMPLHIFEPRYRQLLRDCLNRDRVFGFIYRPQDVAERDIPPGTVGCRATIGDVEPLVDGRANIIVTGGERFALREFLDDEAPYHVAVVEPFGDEREPVAQQTALMMRLQELFADAARAARTLADDAAAPPSLPDDPEAVAFAAASAIDLDLSHRQRLLASPSPSARMRDVIGVLDASLPSLSARAATHSRAKLNGHGPHKNT